MKKAIMIVSLLFGTMFGSHAAFAQNVTYDWVIKNSSSVTIEEDGVPTTTGSTTPYMPSGINAGALKTVSVTEQTSYTTTKFYVGAWHASPYYTEFSCQFVLDGGQVNADGTCTAPTPNAFSYSGAAGKPTCSYSSATQVGTSGCHYQVTFTYSE
jgi:hypothetical protein